MVFEIRIWFYSPHFGWLQFDEASNWVEAQRIEDNILARGYQAVRVSWLGGNGTRYYRTTVVAGAEVIGEATFDPKWDYSRN